MLIPSNHLSCMLLCLKLDSCAHTYEIYCELSRTSQANNALKANDSYFVCVAENSNVCRSAGKFAMMAFMAFAKPKSRMRSASSSTESESYKM